MKMPVATEVREDPSARGLVEEFLRAVDDFAAMQQEHGAALLAGSGKELFSWRWNRERAFRGLARILERVVACGEDDPSRVVWAREILEKLLAEEEVLQKRILARQLQMQEQLLAMRKGKEVLQGYSVNKGQVPRPRYLSSRM